MLINISENFFLEDSLKAKLLSNLGIQQINRNSIRIIIILFQVHYKQKAKNFF